MASSSVTLTSMEAAIDEMGAERFQLSKHRRPILVDLGGQAAQEEEVLQPIHLLVDPGGLGKARPQARVDHAMPAGDQTRFGTGLFLQHHLLEALAVVEAGGQQHILEDGEQFGRLRDDGLAAQDEPQG